MTALLARLRSWFGRSRSTVLPRAGIRVNVPRSVMHRLRVATRPTATNREPLAFLLVRYASEEVRDVVVAFAVLPFADEAYVDGDAGANFDTRWSMSVANEEIRRNAGVLLAHLHGGTGRPAFSHVDQETNIHVMAPLSYGVEVAPYGAIVLSNDDEMAVVAVKGRLRSARVVVVADRIGHMDAP